jgi:hypothetical protein
MGFNRLLAWSMLVTAVAAVACAPETRFRRTALVPAARPYPWNGRTARAGSLRLEGAAQFTDVDQNLLPRVGDTAVLVPQTSLDGAAAVALTNGFEIGLRGSYAAYEWSQRSAVGTMPIPSGPAVYGFGPEVRGTIWFGSERRFGLGFGGNALVYRIPTALWEQDPSCAEPDTCVETNDNLFRDRWRLVEEDSRRPITWNLAIYPSYAFGPGGAYGHVFGGVSTHDGYENNGFSNTSDGPPVESAGFVWFLGAGYGITAGPFRASALLAYPLTGSESAVDYGFPAFFLTLGGDIRLWGGSDEPEAVTPPP